MSSSTPTPTALFVVFFLWLNGLSRHNWCAILLNDIMNLHMSSLDTFVSERPWCVFYSTRSQFYWGLTHVVFHWNSDLISHTQTHTKTHTKTHSTFGASRLTSPYKYIFTPTVIYSEQLFTFHNVFSFQKLFQGIIQKKSASRSRTLPSLLIFYWNFILIRQCQKWSLNRGNVVLGTTIYQTKCPFTVLSALFLFIPTLPYDSRLFPIFTCKI